MKSFKGFGNLRELVRSLRAKRKLTVYYDGQFFRVSANSVQPIERVSTVDVFIFSDGISQEILEVNTELTGKDLLNFTRVNLETKLHINVEDFYIFAHLLRAPGIEDTFKVSASYLPKSSGREVSEHGIKARKILPIEFCLSNYCRQKAKKFSAFFLSEGNQLITVFSVEGYPFEVIRDVAEDGKSFSGDDVYRLLSYINSVYSGFQLEKVFVAGFEEAVPEDVMGIEVIEVDRSEFLSGAVANPYAVKISEYYTEYVSNSLTTAVLVALLLASGYGALNLFEEYKELQSLSRELKELNSSLLPLKRSLVKETGLLKKKVNTLKRLKNGLKILSAGSFSLPEIVNVRKKLKLACKEFKGILFIDEISFDARKGRKVIVKGRVVADSQKNMSRVANRLRKLFRNVKFSVNPPHPPSASFRIEEHV